MILSLPRKYSASGTTIFTQMSALAQQHNAINLAQGFPDFEVDPALGYLLLEASRKGFNQYAPMAGLPGLREEISRYVRHTQAVIINPDTEITLTPGATCAIYTALTTVLQTGDEAIVFEPAYDSYIPNIEMNGAKAVTVPLNAPSFSVDWGRVREAITPKTKAIILTTPHNPTGAALEQSDWEELAGIIRDTGIFIISDEVYEQLVYDNNKHISILRHPELRMRSFVIYSFGKSFHITGWKIGYCIASAKLSEAFRKIHQFLSFSVNTPAQYALTEYLRLPSRQIVRQLMQEKRDLFLSLIEKTPFTIYRPSAGSYFQLAGYERISSLNEKDFAIWLTENFGVATIPVSAFYRNNKENKLVRFCFAKKEETLRAATDRLNELNSFPK